MVYMETHQCSDLCCHQAGSPVDRCNTSRCINDIILKLGLHFKIVGVLSEDKLSFSQHRSMLSFYLQAACCTTDLIKKNDFFYVLCCGKLIKNKSTKSHINSWCLVSWWHQTITSTDVDFSSNVLFGIHLRTISKVPMNLTRKMCLEITFLRSLIASPRGQWVFISLT